MKQEDKDLLLRYLSMALPYNLKLQYQGKDYDYFGIDRGRIFVNIARPGEWLSHTNIYEVKPYLRPMSSMTEEEDKERIRLGIWRNSQAKGCEVTRIIPDTSEDYSSQPLQNALKFLLKKHFDIFGLIPKGLAIAVTEENNPYDTKEEQIWDTTHYMQNQKYLYF